jgi:hypothetical protein
MIRLTFMLAVSLTFLGIVVYVMPKHGTVVYDCRLAEISPDFPTEVKEQCRKLNSQKL